MFMVPLAYKIEYTKVKSLIWVVAGIVSIVLNLVFIPRYGIYAACFNSLITYAVTFLLMLYYGKKAIRITYNWGMLVRVLLISFLYCLLLFMGNSTEWLIVKALLVLPYLYYCLTYILKINIHNKLKNHVKILCNK